jgi:hypothetical protein
MTPRTADDIENAIKSHVALWNAKDRAAWIAHWESVCPGDFILEDPVGTPVKRGHETWGQAWDAAFAESVWTLTIEQCIVCGNEAAVVMINEGSVGGVPVEVRGVEIFAFGDDGSVHQRTYYQLPEGSQYAEWTEQTGDGPN